MIPPTVRASIHSARARRGTRTDAPTRTLGSWPDAKSAYAFDRPIESNLAATSTFRSSAASVWLSILSPLAGMMARVFVGCLSLIRKVTQTSARRVIR